MSGTGERRAVDDDMARFSDEELRVLRADVDRLTEAVQGIGARQERFENVIFTAHAQQEESNRQSASDDRRATHKWMEKFAKDLETMRQSQDNVKSDTAEIIQLNRDIKGALRVGSAVGSFMKWLAGFAVVGAFIGWVYATFGGKPG